MCMLSHNRLCDPMDGSPPVSSVHEILQVRILSGLPFPSPGHLLDPRIKPVSLMSPALVGRFFTAEPHGKPELGRNGNWRQLLCVEKSESIGNGRGDFEELFLFPVRFLAL